MVAHPVAILLKDYFRMRRENEAAGAADAVAWVFGE
jgi:hypothetical protein